MSQRRFFITGENLAGDTIRITGPEAHHLKNVLRLSPGVAVTFLDGRGSRYLARIEQMGKELVTATITRHTQDIAPGVKLHLGQALLKGERMDLAIQKATELGVTSIRPFFSEHGLPRSQKDSRLPRWQRIILESCKQCDQAFAPEIFPPAELGQLLRQPPDADLKLIFWEGENARGLNNLDFAASKPVSIFFLLGPVGGFSQAEVNMARDHGFTPLSLGPRVLRAETATIAATAILQQLSGNLRPSAPEGE